METDFWNNKKIIIYIALLHHTRFLIPIADKLTELGAETKFIVGQGERSQEITAAECNLNYKHVFDYISGKDSNDINENYLRERKTFGDGLKKNYSLGAQMVTVMDKTLHATAAEYIGFRNLVKEEKPDICIALHELNRWGKMFSFWSKKMNIPFLTLQEGLGYNLDFGYTGHIQYSTLCLTWGERIRKKLGDYEAPVERIIPVGNTHIGEEKKQQKKYNTRNKMREKFKCRGKFVNLLVFSAVPLEVETILPIFETTSEIPDLMLIVKFHPADKQDKIQIWKDSITDELKKGVYFIHGEENTYDLLAMCDLCTLAQSSTTGLEAIALNKPLVQLDVEIKTEVPYSFTEQRVATKMNPSELANALSEKTDFAKLIDTKVMDNYLKNELIDTEGAKDRIIEIAEKLIKANKSGFPEPIISSKGKDKYKWSIIIPVPADGAEELLFQLESIAVNSKDCSEYEVILLKPENPSEGIVEILDSLKGDTQIIDHQENSNIAEMMNQACETARGENLIFLSEMIAPHKNWLNVLSSAIGKYGSSNIFGGKVINTQNTIVHAGMVLNENNAPVSAYLHLDSNFPQANIERPFQMLDYFVALTKDSFDKLGGLWEKSGQNAFLDISLRVQQNDSGSDASGEAIYLPDLCLTRLTTKKEQIDFDDSINFYGKWYGTLWENKGDLYNNDGVSQIQLDAARLTSAIKATGK
jgi:Capsule polysaccharide biosynthesis protein